MELATEHGLGIDLIGLAKTAAGAFFGPSGGGAPGVAPAPGGPSAPGPGAPITVSPAIQTEISPQISPVMTQMQASPGAAVQAAPTMFPGGGQTAVPMTPGLEPTPMMPPPQYGYAPQPPYQPIPWGTPTAVQTGEERINWTMIAIAGAAAIAAMAVFGRRPRKRRD